MLGKQSDVPYTDEKKTGNHRVLEKQNSMRDLPISQKQNERLNKSSENMET